MIGLIIYFVFFTSDDNTTSVNYVATNNNTNVNTNNNTNTNVNTNVNTILSSLINSEELNSNTPVNNQVLTENNTFKTALQNTGITEIEPFTNLSFFSNKYEYFGNIGTSEETPIILFNTMEQIIDNYNVFIKTYFPLLNYENMNTQVKKQSGKTIIQILKELYLKNRNFNPITILRNKRTGYKKYMGLVFGMEDKIYFKLLCMSILLLKKLSRPSNNICVYYPHDDPNNNNDFITYIGKCQAKSTVKQIHVSRKSELPTGSLNTNIDGNTLKKISWKDEFLKDLIEYAGFSNENDHKKIAININNFIKSLQPQREQILREYEDEIINSFKM